MDTLKSSQIRDTLGILSIIFNLLFFRIIKADLITTIINILKMLLRLKNIDVPSHYMPDQTHQI